MKIEINKSSRIPLYLQIKEQLKGLIQNGQLFKGMQLPTERELSHQLKVSRNTVSMAYKELSLEKIISSTSGKGTFITAETGSESHLLSNTQKSAIIRKIDSAIEALNQIFQLKILSASSAIAIKRRELCRTIFI